MSKTKKRDRHTRNNLYKNKKHRPSPIISDHCLLRYLDRVKGWDVESIRHEILTEDLKKAVKLQVTSIVIDGVKYKIGAGRVTTCY